MHFWSSDEQGLQVWRITWHVAVKLILVNSHFLRLGLWPIFCLDHFTSTRNTFIISWHQLHSSRFLIAHLVSFVKKMHVARAKTNQNYNNSKYDKYVMHMNFINAGSDVILDIIVVMCKHHVLTTNSWNTSAREKLSQQRMQKLSDALFCMMHTTNVTGVTNANPPRFDSS